MQFSTAEKVATIVFSFISSGMRSGTFGELVYFEAGPAECPYPAGWRVVADGKTFIVRRHRCGWEVRFGGFAGIDASLEEATHNALSGGQGRNVCSVEQALGL